MFTDYNICRKSIKKCKGIVHKIQHSVCLGGERKGNGFLEEYPGDFRGNGNVIFLCLNGLSFFILNMYFIGFKIYSAFRGSWVAQSVKRLTSAQVMISWFVGLSPASGSVLIAQNLEPVLSSVSLSLSAPSPLTLCLSLSQK